MLGFEGHTHTVSTHINTNTSTNTSTHGKHAFKSFSLLIYGSSTFSSDLSGYNQIECKYSYVQQTCFCFLLFNIGTGV